MLGNDIIDINETRRSTNWKRPRFLEKIFTSDEQDIISNSIDPFTTVWRLWSMKESAYKVFIQTGGNPFFTPTKIECKLNSRINGEVKIDLLKLKTSTSINSNYIFSSAIMSDLDISTNIFKLPENRNKQHSEFIYQKIIADFSKSKTLNPKELRILKTKDGVPQIYFKNKGLENSLSITHHGNFGAYSILKN